MLYLQSPRGDKGYMLCLAGEGECLRDKFLKLPLLMPRALRWFMQSNTPTFLAFEFWTTDAAAIADAAERVAKALVLPLEIR